MEKKWKKSRDFRKCMHFPSKHCSNADEPKRKTVEISSDLAAFELTWTGAWLDGNFETSNKPTSKNNIIYKIRSSFWVQHMKTRSMHTKKHTHKM